jgi:hypothetical protein
MGQDFAPAETASGGAGSASGGPEGDEPAGKSSPDVASLDTRPDGDEPDGKESSRGGEPDTDPAGDQPAGREGPGMARRDTRRLTGRAIRATRTLRGQGSFACTRWRQTPDSAAARSHRGAEAKARGSESSAT